MATVHSLPVLQAVANPPTMFFVPVAIAGINLALHVVVWLLTYSIFSLPPIAFLISAIFCHSALIGVCARDMHLESVIKAYAAYSRPTRNLIPAERGVNKYVP